MKTKEMLKQFKEITEQMYKIAESKNHDYSGNNDNPFRNFEMVEYLGITSTEQGFLTRITDKLSRVNNFVQTGTLKVKDEKIEDTLLDLANYSLLMLLYIKSKKNYENNKNNKTRFRGK